ncbi:MAG TPA: hypothetical protein VJ969_12970 [Desulfopila sp.]|nr:hypothetical protein [Desulfopila sp.]
MNDNTFQFFSESDIYALLTMEKCIEAMHEAFSALSHGKAVMPPRMRLMMEEDNANALFMPVYLPGSRTVGVKTVTNNIDNISRKLPIVHAMMMVFDSVTGVPLAVLNGEAITAMRTGAVSGLATSLLARKDSRTAAIIGTGTQGETQLEAICAARPITKAYVFDLNVDKARDFARTMSGKLHIEVVSATSPADLAEADVICTATPSKRPVFDDKYLKKGVHINGVGSYKPDMLEVPVETTVRAKVVVDRMESCLAEAGDLAQPLEQGVFTREHIHGELGDVATGKISSRESDEEITFFKSAGVAVQDLVCANLVIAMAKEKKLGTTLTL